MYDGGGGPLHALQHAVGTFMDALKVLVSSASQLERCLLYSLLHRQGIVLEGRIKVAYFNAFPSLRIRIKVILLLLIANRLAR